MRSFIIIGLITVLLVGCEAPTFRGMRWGIELAEVQDQLYEPYEYGDSVSFSKKGEYRKMGDVGVSTVRYTFHYGRFCQSSITVLGFEAYDSVLTLLKDKYGNDGVLQGDTFIWKTRKGVEVSVVFDTASQLGIVVYTHRGLLDKLESAASAGY